MKKIFLICSKAFYSQLASAKAQLEGQGWEVYIPWTHDNPEAESQWYAKGPEVHSRMKSEMFRRSRERIRSMDAVLTLNFDKNGQKNYIGGSTFLELYEAFMEGKKIYLLNDIPEGLLYDEISAFSPTVIHGDLEKVSLSGGAMDWNFTPMTADAAQAIALWQYEPPYDFYNWEEEDGPAGPLVPGAFVCLDTQGQPMGFFTFGEDGRIPTVEESPYAPGFLDIGLGLRPDLCGKGLGAGFVQAGLSFGREEYQAEHFRLSVAAFNKRAIKTYEKCGFAPEREVTNAAYKDPKLNKFLIMTR